MRPRIRKFLTSLYSTPDSKALEIKFNLSSHCDFELLKRLKNELPKHKNAIRSILYERGYTTAEISVLTN